MDNLVEKKKYATIVDRDMKRGLRMKLQKAKIGDAAELLQLQKIAFTELFNTYKDYETNPANETIEIIIERMKQNNSTYYFIAIDTIKIGAIRIVKSDEHTMRISPIFILPEYQGQGYAQEAMAMVEKKEVGIEKFSVDTIKQEPKLCYFYKKIGYKQLENEYPITPQMTLITFEKERSRVYGIPNK